MATSVKMTEEDKHRLDRLQGELMVHTGRRVSQQELLSRLLNLGEAERERLLEEGTIPMSAHEIDLMSHLCVDSHKRTREEDIDRAVAGEMR